MNSAIKGFTAATAKGIVYSPTWPTFTPGGPGQLSDSDFFDDAFQGLWNTGSQGSNQYRNDLATMGNANFNLVRLYNWGPTRGWGAPATAWPSQWQIPTKTPPPPPFERGNGHINALDYALQNGMQVIVPVSNYFLSDDKFAWNGNEPDSDFSFTSAPLVLQQDLIYFLSSICHTDSNGSVTMHPAVASISVGNEIDINNFIGQGTSGAVGPTARLKRVMWWFVNLAAQMTAMGVGPVGLTSPISNADQGHPGTNPFSYWFGAFVNGVTATTNLPQGTKQGTTTETTFSEAVSGVSSFTAVSALYYNSVNIYQSGAGLTATLTQYDNWSSTPNQNNTNWPGQQFTCPLLLTEIGWSRPDDKPDSQETQYDLYTKEMVGTIQTYLAGNSSSYLAGYCLYEFNDEAWLGAAQDGFGIFMQPSTNESLNTGTTAVSYGSFPPVGYPVYTLQSVANKAGTTLISELTTLQA